MLFYLVGSDVRQAHDQPHASLCHELAGQWINLSTNSFKAQAQPGRPGGLCRPWPGEGPGRSWDVRSSLCCRNAAARQVPGLGPAETTIKLFVWAGISIKTIGKKNRRVGSCKMKSKVLPPIPGKVYHFMLSSVSGCHIMIDFLLLGYYYQS